MRLDVSRRVFDSRVMWIRRYSPAFARMPSMRPATLNPRAPALAGASPAPARAVAPAPGKPPVAPVPAGKRNAKGATPASASPDGAKEDDAGRAGGFHESSYELQSGLQISESEWPDDVTVPGALGER